MVVDFRGSSSSFLEGGLTGVNIGVELWFEEGVGWRRFENVLGVLWVHANTQPTESYCRSADDAIGKNV